MKITYFLRGMGVGIIFASVILFISFKTTPATMSNEDIISRAKQLGMVEAPRENDLDGILSSDASSDASGDAASEKKKGDSEKQGKKEKEDSEKKDSGSDDKDLSAGNDDQNTGSNEVSEAHTGSGDQDGDTDEKAGKKENLTESEATTESAAGGQVTFSIHSGEYSEELSQNLYSLGVVKDADDFNRFLCSNGYASRLHVGTYTVSKGEDYAAIASKIIQ